MDRKTVPTRGDLAGCIASSLRMLRDVRSHLREHSPAEPRMLDVPTLARLDAFIARTNDRAVSIMSALELQSLTAQKVQRVCSTGTAEWPVDDIRHELSA